MIRDVDLTKCRQLNRAGNLSSKVDDQGLTVAWSCDQSGRMTRSAASGDFVRRGFVEITRLPTPRIIFSDYVRYPRMPPRNAHPQSAETRIIGSRALAGVVDGSFWAPRRFSPIYFDLSDGPACHALVPVGGSLSERVVEGEALV